MSTGYNNRARNSKLAPLTFWSNNWEVLFWEVCPQSPIKKVKTPQMGIIPPQLI